MSDWWQRFLEVTGQGLNALGFDPLKPKLPDFTDQETERDLALLGHPILSQEIMNSSPITKLKEFFAGDVPYEKQVEALLAPETELSGSYSDTDVAHAKALRAAGLPVPDISPESEAWQRGFVEGGLKSVVPLAERATTVQNLALMLGSGLLGQSTAALAGTSAGALGEAKAGVDVVQNLEKARRAAVLGDFSQKLDQAINLGFTAEGIKGLYDISAQDIPLEEKLPLLAESGGFAVGGLHALGQPKIEFPSAPDLENRLVQNPGKFSELELKVPEQPTPDLGEGFDILQPTPDDITPIFKDERSLLGNLDLEIPRKVNKKSTFLPEQKNEGALSPKWLSTEEIHTDLDPTYGTGRGGVYTRDQFSPDEINAPPDHDLFAWNPVKNKWVSAKGPIKNSYYTNLSLANFGRGMIDLLNETGQAPYYNYIYKGDFYNTQEVLKLQLENLSDAVNNINEKLGYTRYIIQTIPTEYYREVLHSKPGNLSKTDRIYFNPEVWKKFDSQSKDTFPRMDLEGTPEGEIDVPHIIDLFHAATPEGKSAPWNKKAALSFDEIQAKLEQLQSGFEDRTAKLEELRTTDSDVKHLSDFVTRAGEYLKADPVLSSIVPKAKEFAIIPGLDIDAIGIGGETTDTEIQINLPGIIDNLYRLGRTDVSPTTAEVTGVPAREMRQAGQHLLDIYSSKPEQLAEDLWYSTVFTTLHEMAHTEPGSEHSGRFSSAQQKFEAIYNSIIAATTQEHVNTLKGFFDGPTALRAADKIHALSGESVSGIRNGENSVSRQSRVAESGDGGGKASFDAVIEKLVPKEVIDQVFTHRKTQIEFDSPFDKFAYFVAKEAPRLTAEHPGLAALISNKLGIKYDDILFHGSNIRSKINKTHRAGMEEIRVPKQKYLGGTTEKVRPLDINKILAEPKAKKVEQPTKTPGEKQRGWVEWVNERHAEDFSRAAVEEKFSGYAGVDTTDFLDNPFAYRDLYDHINTKIKAMEDAGLTDWQAMSKLAYSLVDESSHPLLKKFLSEVRSSGTFGERKEGAEFGEQKFSFENIQKLYERIEEYNAVVPDDAKIILAGGGLDKFAGIVDSLVTNATNNREFANFLFANGHVVRGMDLSPEAKAKLVRLNSDLFPFGDVLPQQWADKNGEYYARPGFASKFDEYLTFEPKEAAGKALKRSADVFRTIKNIQLSSGIPNTWLNTHGVSLGFRRVMSGSTPFTKEFWQRAKEVITDPTGVKSLEWLDKHVPEAADAVRHGLTLVSEEHTARTPKKTSRTLSGVKRAVIESVAKAGEDSKFFNNLSGNKAVRGAQKGVNFVAKYGQKLSAFHTELFDVPTFQRALIGWKLRTWLEVTNELIKSGATEKAAKTQAATYVNNAYGGLNVEAAARSKTFGRVMNILLLAPDWFESNFGFPNLQSSTSFGTGDPVFRESFKSAGWQGSKEFGILKNTLKGKKLYLRMATNYGLFFTFTTMLNLLINDQLDPGLERPSRLATVEIPWNDFPDLDKRAFLRLQSTSGDPYFLPFIVAASMAKEGHPLPATSIGGKYYWYRAGIPFKAAATLPPFSIDRFGDPINYKRYGGKVDPNDAAVKLFREWVSIVSPPYLDASIGYLSGNQGILESTVQGLEFPPMRFSHSPGLIGRPVEDDNEYKELQRELRKAFEEVKSYE